MTSTSANNLKRDTGKLNPQEVEKILDRNEHKKNLHQQGTRTSACSHCCVGTTSTRKENYPATTCGNTRHLYHKEGKITSIKCKRSTTKTRSFCVSTRNCKQAAHCVRQTSQAYRERINKSLHQKCKPECCISQPPTKHRKNGDTKSRRRPGAKAKHPGY